ncbi:hypothetical protein ABZ590_26825 [Streptomyces hirsutus]|uniref:hypothetical protein n=1 Tax=Streptomyces hirsutus TaxID=35620 RepID=UPI003409A4E3
MTLAEPVEVVCRRWRIEECCRLGKSFTGLDQGQVTCWNSWMRWSLFSLIAAAVLALTHTATTKAGPAGAARLIPLTCPGLLRHLRVLALPRPVRDRDHVLHWTAWRRRHQHTAATCHRHLTQDAIPC